MKPALICCFLLAFVALAASSPQPEPKRGAAQAAMMLQALGNGIAGPTPEDAGEGMGPSSSPATPAKDDAGKGMSKTTTEATPASSSPATPVKGKKNKKGWSM